MKQKKLVKNLYAAILAGDKEAQKELYRKEMEKIFKRKESGKPFTPRWTVVR